MARLNLINQETYKAQILPKMIQLKNQLDARADIWAKLDRDKKRRWVKSDKDPIMKLAFQMGQYFRDNFPELLEDYNG